MKNFLALGLLFLILSSGTPTVAAPIVHTKNVTTSGSNCVRAAYKDEWLKISYEDVIAKLGKPVSDEEFMLSQTALPEFRLSLKNHQQSLKRGANFAVREVTWPVADCRLTLWFKSKNMERGAIGTLYWKKGLEF